MEPISAVNEIHSALTILYETYQSLRVRYENASQNPALVTELGDIYNRLCTQVSPLVEECKRNHFNLSKHHHDILLHRVGKLRTFVTESRKQLEESGQNDATWLHRFRTANTANEWLEQLKDAAEKAEDDVVQIVACFAPIEGIARVHAAVNDVRQVVEAGFGISSETTDSFHPSFDVPLNPLHVVLHFDSGSGLDRESTDSVTIEAQLKRAVLQSKKSENVSAVGSTGMGGVGKSCALRGLASDDEIRLRFEDGVYFLSLGMDANEVRVVRELSSMVEQSGGTRIAREIGEQRDIDGAVRKAKTWFRGRCILFLIDDVWGSSEVGGNILRRLTRVVDEENGSRVAFTTRDRDVAAGSKVVQFGVRDEKVSRGILLKCTGVNGTDVEKSEELVSRVMDRCGGLPMALSVAGRAIGKRHDAGMKWEEAFEEYLCVLDKYDGELLRGEDRGYEYKNLQSAYATSLAMLEEDISKRSHFNFPMRVSRMYRALVIQERQGWVPVSVLCLLWGTDEADTRRVVQMFAERSLGERTERMMNGSETSGLSLHDLQLDFVRQRCKEEGEVEKWHEKLVRRWLPVPGERTKRWKKLVSSKGKSRFRCAGEESDGEEEEERGITLMRGRAVRHVMSRSRKPVRVIGSRLGTLISEWSRQDVFKDEYFRNNVCRHLRSAELARGLHSLLLNPSWASSRLCAGESLSLDEDFNMMLRCLREGEESGSRGARREVESTAWCLEMIRAAAKLSAGHVSRNPREVWFQLRTRLVGVGRKSGVIREYLKNIERYAERPWVKTKMRCLNEPGGALESTATCDGKVTGVCMADDAGRAYAWGVNDDRKGFICRLMKGQVEEEVWLNETEEENGGASERTGTREENDSSPTEQDASATSSNNADGNEAISTSSNQRAVITAICCTSDGSHAVTGHEDGGIRIWNARTGEAVYEPLRGHRGRVHCVAWSPDGRRVASGGEDKTIQVWDVEKGEAVCEPLRDLSDWVCCVAWSPDGRRVASAGWCKTVQAWDVEKGEAVCEPLRGHDDPVKCVAWSPDGRRVASGGDDRTVQVWDVEKGEAVCEPLRGHNDSVFCVAWSPDGRRVVSGGFDETVRVWDVEKGEAVCEPLRGYSESAYCVAWSPDGRRVASGGVDGTVQVWDVEKGEAVWNGVCGAAVDSLSFLRDAKHNFLISNVTNVVMDSATGERVEEPRLEWIENALVLHSGGERETLATVERSMAGKLSKGFRSYARDRETGTVGVFEVVM